MSEDEIDALAKEAAEHEDKGNESGEEEEESDDEDDGDNLDERKTKRVEKMGCRRMRVKAEKNPRIQTEITNTTGASIRKIYRKMPSSSSKAIRRGEDV